MGGLSKMFTFSFLKGSLVVLVLFTVVAEAVLCNSHNRGAFFRYFACDLIGPLVTHNSFPCESGIAKRAENPENQCDEMIWQEYYRCDWHTRNGRPRVICSPCYRYRP